MLVTFLSCKGKDTIAGAKIQLLFELIKEKLNENDNDDDLFNEDENQLRRVRMRPASWRSISTMPFKGIRVNPVNPWSILFLNCGKEQ